MNAEKTSLTKDIEELISKSVEANKVFISESSKLLQQFTVSGKKNTSGLLQTNFITDAFYAYAKLNIQHLKNVLDLSVSLIKQAGTQSTEQTTTGNTNAEEEAAPSFVLKAEAEAGTVVSLSFLLDNIKEEAAMCKLVNTAYYYQPDNAVAENFVTDFSPQSFMLDPGAQLKVNIVVTTTNNAKPGLYISNVQVQGFEPAFFSICLTITETITKTSNNGRKKRK
jgi:hypothetical protein